MAEHPSTPNYGGLPFSPSPPVPSPRPLQGQQPQQAQISSPFSSLTHAPSHMSPVYPAVSANASAFDTNSRIPGLGGLLAPPPPPPPEFLKQLVNSPLPPPPFPPVPIPQVGHPTIPGLGSDPSFATSRPPAEISSRALEYRADALQVVNEEALEVVANKEEGELSDGELDEYSSHSAGEIQEAPNVRNVFQRQTQAHADPYMSDDGGSISSYNPPSASSVDHVDTPQSTFPPNNPVANREIGTILDPAVTKTRAKQAILELLPYDIGFHNLVEEGIQEDTLRRLYQEFDIKDKTLEARIIERKLDANQGSRTDTSGALKKNIESDLLGDKHASPPHSLPAPGNVSHQSASNSANAAVERKDRIAQLLAMKAAKSAKSQSPTTLPAQDMPATAKMPPTANIVSAIESEQANGHGTILDSSSKKKNKAQTDLVRAKMEALKQQALAKAQAQKTLSSASHGILSNSRAQSSAKKGPSPPVPSNTRHSQKRPLASDLFEEENQLAKRVEMAMSEDEGEVSDEGMDLDGGSDHSQGEIGNSCRPLVSEQAAATGSFSRPTTQTREPSLNALNMSPLASLSGTPAKEKGQEDVWRAKNDEIARMRKQIAELEQRRKAKQSLIQQGQSPSPGTPRSAAGMSAESPLPVTPTAERLEVLTTSNGSKVLSMDSKRAPSSGSTSTPPPATATARAEALRRRLIRRREIQAGIPVIDAEVERTRSRLADIKVEAELLEAALQKGLDHRQQLLRELELLGVDTEAVHVDRMRLPELKAIRDEIVETKLQDLASAGQTSHDILATAGPEAERDSLSPADPATERHGQLASQQPSQEPAISLQDHAESIHRASPAVAESGHPTDVDVDKTEVEGADDASSIGSAMDESEPSSDEEMAEGVNSMAATDAPAAVQTTGFNSDGGADLSLSVNELRPATARKLDEYNTNAKSDDDSGSISMSDSASESSDEYEPRDDGTSDALDAQPDTKERNGADGINDEYEPMDILVESEEDFHSISKETAEAVQDRENSDELADSNVLVMSTEIAEPAAPAEEPKLLKSKYIPYDSVLKNFRSYRFNPAFSDSVPGGFRSLTYSSKIDLSKVLCDAEARGEVCQSPNCENQHFSQMGLPDDKILVEMSAAPGMDRESRNKYVNGLKLVIADLRNRGVKEFEQVALALAAYRRRFEAEHDPMLLPPQLESNGAPSAPVPEVIDVESSQPSS